MTNQTIKSTFQLQFTTPGAQQAQKTVAKLSKSMSAGSMTTGMNALSKVMTKNMRQMAMMQKQVASMASTFAKLNTVVLNFGKALAKVQMPGGCGSGGSSGGGGAPAPTPRAAAAPRAKHSGSFFRGVLTGAGYGHYYPQENKAGMVRQAMGTAVGRSASSIIGGAASAPFTGLSGIAMAASGVPLFGGTMAGLLGQGQSAATAGLEYQQSKIGLGGFLTRGSYRQMGRLQAQAEAARSKIMAEQYQAFGAYDGPTYGGLTFDQRRRTHGGDDAAISKKFGLGIDPDKNLRKNASDSARKGFEMDRQKRADAAFSAVMGQDIFGRLSDMGKDFGKSATQTNQFALAMLQRSGGSVSNLLNSGLLKAGMGAETVFGAGPEVTGAFGKGVRRGGLTGTGSAGDQLTAAIKEGVTAGMDRTEVHDFLDLIAKRQDEFARTGLPVDPKSLAALTGSIAATGLGQSRGANLASGFTSRIQQVGQGGPQTAADFLLMQTMGFKGGGLKGLEDVMDKMENMKDMSPEDFLRFVGAVSKGSGGNEAGRFALKSVFKSNFNTPLTVADSKFLQSASEGDINNLSPEMRDKVMAARDAAAASQRAGAGFDLSSTAKAAQGLGPNVGLQADVDNLLIFAGNKLLPSMQELEKSQALSVTALANLEPTLKAISAGVVDIAKNFPEFTQAIQNFISKFIGDPNVHSGGKSR